MHRRETIPGLSSRPSSAPTTSTLEIWCPVRPWSSPPRRRPWLTLRPVAATVRAATTCCVVSHAMRCPWCNADADKVVDSRPADSGMSVRRRRECTACHRRFTTFERVEDVGLVVVKRDGSKDPFAREKVSGSVLKAIKNRPVTTAQVERLVDRVEERMRRKGPGGHLGSGRGSGPGRSREAGPGRVYAFRQRLQGLSGDHRLRARARLLAEERAGETPVVEGPSSAFALWDNIRGEPLDVVAGRLSCHIMLTWRYARSTIPGPVMTRV